MRLLGIIRVDPKRDHGVLRRQRQEHQRGREAVCQWGVPRPGAEAGLQPPAPGGQEGGAPPGASQGTASVRLRVHF